MREGSLEAPTRHPIAWKDPAFHDEGAAFKELERVRKTLEKNFGDVQDFVFTIEKK